MGILENEMPTFMDIVFFQMPMSFFPHDTWQIHT
jgi:hypothetical protein